MQSTRFHFILQKEPCEVNWREGVCVCVKATQVIFIAEGIPKHGFP